MFFFNAIKEIEPTELKTYRDKGYKLVDVRGEDEYHGELGHIDGAQLVTLGEPLQSWLENQDRSQRIIFVCRSGGRSSQATQLALKMKFADPINLKGGMLLWNSTQVK